MSENTKHCPKCNADKLISAFYTNQNICKTCRHQKDKEWNRSHPWGRQLIATKSRCKKLGIPFDLDIEDLKVPEFCPVLGIRLEINNKMQDNSPSLDRVIPSLGYVKGNVHVISARANRIKNDGSLAEHLQVVEYLKKHLKTS